MSSPTSSGSFIVEDGSGISNANSYVTVSDAENIYLAKYGLDGDASWSGATTEEKEDALRRAAQEYLEGCYYDAWRGSVSSYDQKLSWPRVGASDDAGRVIDSDEIPDGIKEANVIVALDIIQGGTIIADGFERGAITRETKKGVGFELTTAYGEPTSTDSTQRRMRRADMLVYPYIADDGGSVNIF